VLTFGLPPWRVPEDRPRRGAGRGRCPRPGRFLGRAPGPYPARHPRVQGAGISSKRDPAGGGSREGEVPDSHTTQPTRSLYGFQVRKGVVSMHRTRPETLRRPSGERNAAGPEEIPQRRSAAAPTKGCLPAHHG
jgi:hypothetical protein